MVDAVCSAPVAPLHARGRRPAGGGSLRCQSSTAARQWSQCTHCGPAPADCCPLCCLCAVAGLEPAQHRLWGLGVWSFRMFASLIRQTVTYHIVSDRLLPVGAISIRKDQAMHKPAGVPQFCALSKYSGQNLAYRLLQSTNSGSQSSRPHP